MLARKALSRNLSHKVEWLVQGEGVPMPDPSPIPFKITPDTLENVKKRDRGSVPEFCITGSIDSSVMSLTRPLTGDIVVEKCSVPIQSVELQLVRVETCGCADGFAKEATGRCRDLGGRGMRGRWRGCGSEEAGSPHVQ